MASIEESGGNNMVMPVGPMYGNNGGGTFGMGNDAGWWVVLLIIILAGRSGFGGNAGNGYDAAMGVQAGFNQAALTSSMNNLQQTMWTGFSTAESSANARQIADMQQRFAMQQQFSDCCCENRLGIANLQSQIYQENCADRQAVNDALMNLTQQMNNGFQSIRNEFCQDRLDRKDEKIAELQAIINEKDRLAANTAMEARIVANNEAQTTALEQYLAPVARPAYIVQNPNCCSQNYGYGGCGCGVAA